MVSGFGGYVLKEDCITKAKRLAIPIEIIKNLPPQALYIIDKKTPEAIAKYWELTDFIKYLLKKYRLTKENYRSFIFSSKNITQKDRELLVAWFLARFIEGIHNKKLHYALALPKEDRGIDCYIRIIDFDNENLTALPIQVCDIPMKSDLLEESKIEEIIFSGFTRAKSKPIDCSDAILLLHLLGRGEEIIINIDRFKIRDLFEKQKPLYRKIILQIDSQARNEFCTLFCESKDEHFRGIRENIKSKIIIGRTLKDEKKSVILSNKKGKIEYFM